MTGLLGCRLHRLPGGQFAARSVTPAIHFCAPYQSQSSASRSKQFGILACDRSRTRPLRHKQRMQCSHGSNADTLATHTHADDLLVVGPGVLGSYVGMLWQQQHPTATVTGQTNSTTNHDRYSSRNTFHQHLAMLHSIKLFTCAYAGCSK